MEKEESIKVYIRVRPADSYEQESAGNSSCCLEVTTPTTLTLNCQPEPKTFTFDHVTKPDTSQETVFTTVGRPIIDSCMSGYNGTVFAYGQTGSGKTFTMIGPSDEETDCLSHELRGLIPRSFEYLFSLITREKQKYGDLIEFLCKCSFLEIYNEQVYDLLDQASPGLHLRENIKRGVYVDGISEETVTSANETYQVLTRGWTNRRVASTSMNRESSRSHAVFMLSVESKTKESSNGVCKIRSSTLNLVDLAGSERQRDTQTDGARLKEAGSINRSLSALGNVIMSLVEIAHGKSRHVHYRDSKLTFLLRDSLGGNAKTTLIANVHPLAKCFGETLSTLQFARRAKMIKNKAVVNEDTAGNVIQLQAEIKKLKELLAQTHSSNSSCNASLSKVGVVSGSGQPESEEVDELKEMLANSIALRDRAVTDKGSLLEKVDKLQELCKRREKSLQSTKMILKLRDSRIAALEGRQQLEPNDTIKLLKEEIQQLKSYNDHHPDVTKFAAENLDLRAELKQLKEAANSTADSKEAELLRLHQYTLQLEKQLRGGCVRQSTAGGSVSELTQLNLETERLRQRCQQLQNELNTARQVLSSQEEEHKEKCFSLETALKLTNRSNQNLQQTIESLKLKHSLERDLTNTSHLKTIEAIASPRGVRQSKSVTSTPLAAGPHPRRQFFTPLLRSVARNFSDLERDKEEKEVIEEEVVDERKQEVIEEEVVEERKQELIEEEVDDRKDAIPEVEEEFEIVYGNEVLDNLRTLQATNADLTKKLESQDVKLLALTSDNEKLQLQLSEVKEYYQHELAHLTEERKKNQLLLSEMESTNTVLTEEIQDLKLCLKSADRELVEVKREAHEETVQHETDKEKLLQNTRELDHQLSAIATEYERSLQQLQNIQNEIDTLREEMVFKDHYLSEKDKVIQSSQSIISDLETQVQMLEDQVSVEREKISALTQEEEGSKVQLSTALSDNASLMNELFQLRKEYEEKLDLKEKELDAVKSSLNSMSHHCSQQSSSIASLTSTVKELRDRETDLETKLLTAKTELDESQQHLSITSQTVEQLTDRVSSLTAQLETATDRHCKELQTRDIQSEVLAEEIEFLQSQLQELRDSEEESKRNLKRKEEELDLAKRQIASKETELQQLMKIQEEKESLLEQVKSLTHNEDVCGFFETQTEHLLQLESERNQYRELLTELQEQCLTREERLGELESELVDYERIQREHELLQTQHISLQYRVEADREEHRKNEEDLQIKLSVQGTKYTELEQLVSSLSDERDELRIALMDTQSQLTVTCEKVLLTEEHLNRVREQEEMTFKEKESLKSQLEILIEEKAKIMKEYQELVKENAQLSGHRNLRQRIQFHVNLKEKYHKLLEDYRLLEEKYEQQVATSEPHPHNNQATPPGAKGTHRVLRSSTKQQKENMKIV